MGRIVAISGPAGVGKSSILKRVSEAPEMGKVLVIDEAIREVFQNYQSEKVKSVSDLLDSSLEGSLLYLSLSAELAERIYSKLKEADERRLEYDLILCDRHPLDILMFLVFNAGKITAPVGVAYLSSLTQKIVKASAFIDHIIYAEFPRKLLLEISKYEASAEKPEWLKSVLEDSFRYSELLTVWGILRQTATWIGVYRLVSNQVKAPVSFVRSQTREDLIEKILNLLSSIKTGEYYKESS